MLQVFRAMFASSACEHSSSLYAAVCMLYQLRTIPVVPADALAVLLLQK